MVIHGWPVPKRLKAGKVSDEDTFVLILKDGKKSLDSFWNMP